MFKRGTPSPLVTLPMTAIHWYVPGNGDIHFNLAPSPRQKHGCAPGMMWGLNYFTNFLYIFITLVVSLGGEYLSGFACDVNNLTLLIGKRPWRVTCLMSNNFPMPEETFRYTILDYSCIVLPDSWRIFVYQFPNSLKYSTLMQIFNPHANIKPLL